MLPIPPHESQRALRALGVAPEDLEAIRRSPLPKAQELLKALKKKAHRQYKKLALELHPDRTQGDEAKAEFFVLLTRVLEEFDKVSVQTQPVAHRIQVTYAPINTSTFTWTNPIAWQQATSTSGTRPPGFTAAQVVRVVKMRPK